MVNKQELLALHKYFLNANMMKMNFDILINKLEKPTEIGDITEQWGYLSLWYGCLRVVLEGWQDLKLSDVQVDLLIDEDKIKLLNGFRNDVFHFKADYFSSRTRNLLNDKDFVLWIRNLHDLLGASILRLLKAEG